MNRTRAWWSILLLVLLSTVWSVESVPTPQGPWQGAIDIAGMELKIIVTFETNDDGLGAKIDIPQQGAYGLRLQHVRQEGDAVHFELPAGPGLAVFDGRIEGSKITGDFTQAGMTGTFHLEPAGQPKETEAAPPAPDLPYQQEEARFEHDGISLAGTLTLPEDGAPHPAVVLLTGSGPQNRDEEVFGFKPFALIADHLTRHGIAVLRYDDRGVGGSTGDTMDSTSEDFAGDAAAAVAWLRARDDIDAGRVGLLGHSDGAIAAAIAASREPLAFIVLMAGPALPGERILRFQAEAIAKASGASDDAIAAVRKKQDSLFAAVRAGEGLEELGVAGAELDGVRSRWYRYFLDFDPAGALSKVTCPVLALYGGKDMQVPAGPDRDALEAALAEAGNTRVTVRVYPEANHLFQAANSGSPAEYPTLEKKFVEGFLEDLTGWIRETTKR